MKSEGIKSIVFKKYKHQNSKPNPAPAGNILSREFEAKGLGEKIVGDITYIKTEKDGWCYLALFVFLFSVLIPFLKLIAQVIVLICIFYKKSLNIGRFFYRGYQVFREWGMLEVYLFGIIVSIVKLIDMADVKVT